MKKFIKNLSEDLRKGHISRRDFLKSALASGAGLPLATSILAACAPQEAAPATTLAEAVLPTKAPAVPGKLIFGAGSDVSSFDPNSGEITGIDEAMLRNLYDGLIDWTGKPGEYVPALATEWSVGPDEVTWTFKLRPDIKFSDGSTFDADVVKYNIDRALEFANFRVGPHVKEVKVVDKGTVQFISPKPDAGFLDNISWAASAFVRIEAYKKYGEEVKLNPVGTGPFLFEEWRPGEQLALKKNPNYWREHAKVDQVVYRPIAEYGSRVLALESGDVDLISNVAVADVNRLKAAVQGVKVETSPSVRCMNLIPNLTKPALNKEVLQALNYAIDREAICKNIMAGLTRPSTNYISTTNFGYRDPVPTYSFNPEKAKELLAQGGYAPGTVLTIMHTEGRYYGDRAVAEAVQAMWKAIGVDTELWLVEWPTYAKWMWSVGPEDPNVQKRDFALTDWGAQDPVFAIWAEVTGDWPPKGGNATFTDDPEMVALVNKAWATLDPEQYKNVLGDLQDLIADKGYRVFIMEQSQVFAMKKGVNGFVATPNNHWPLRSVYWT